jgi:hypothetical protein
VWFVIHDSVKLKTTQFKYVGIVCVISNLQSKTLSMFPQPYIQSCRFKQMISQHGCSRLSIASGHPYRNCFCERAANSISEITAIPFQPVSLQWTLYQSQDFHDYSCIEN